MHVNTEQIQAYVDGNSGHLIKTTDDNYYFASICTPEYCCFRVLHSRENRMSFY